MVERYRAKTSSNTNPGSGSTSTADDPRPRGNPKFQKGMPRPANAGRKVGTINRSTKLIKDAVTGAGARAGMLEPIYRFKEIVRGKGKSRKVLRLNTGDIIGWKPTGKGGLEGYLLWLACNEPRAYAALVGRTLPLQINAELNPPSTVTDRFAGADFSSMSLPEKMAAMKEMIGLTKPYASKPALPAPKPRMSASDNDVTEGEFTEVSPEYREAAE